MSQTPAEVLCYEIRLPNNSTRPMAAITTGSGAAVSLNLTTLLSDGPCYITLESVTADNYVLESATATTAVTTVTGKKIEAGKDRDYWMTPDFPYLDILGSTTGSLKYCKSSRQLKVG
jgi:hypothetical protein